MVSDSHNFNMQRVYISSDYGSVYQRCQIIGITFIGSTETEKACKAYENIYTKGFKNPLNTYTKLCMPQPFRISCII